MTTHDAIALQKNTPIHWINPGSRDAPPLHGLASPDEQDHIRIIWNDTVEPNSLVRTSDRIMLAAVHITEPRPEPGS